MDLYVSCYASKTNLLRVNAHLLLKVHKTLDDKRHSTAQYIQRMKHKKTAELSEIIVGKERRARTSHEDDPLSHGKKAYILKDDGASNNFESESYLTQLRQLKGVVLQEKDQGMMLVKTADNYNLT